MKPPLIEVLSVRGLSQPPGDRLTSGKERTRVEDPTPASPPPPSGTIGRRWHHRRGTTGTNAHKPPREPKQVALRKEHGRAPAHWKPTLSPCPQRTSGVPSLWRQSPENSVSALTCRSKTTTPSIKMSTREGTGLMHWTQPPLSLGTRSLVPKMPPISVRAHSSATWSTWGGGGGIGT